MPITVKYTNFDISKLNITIPVENMAIPEITKYQLMSIPDYDASGMPTIQGPWINLDNYGVPSKTDKFGKPRLNQGGQQLSDRERGKIKIPLNMNIDESKKLHEFLSSIDKKLEENRDIIFGDKKSSMYKYQPMVRQPAEDPDAPIDAPEKPDYFVLKFDFDNKTNQVKTKVYLNNDGERSEVEIKSLDDVLKHLRYKCEFRPIFTFSKLFATRSAGDDGKRKYGIGLKLKMVEIKPMISTKTETETFFIDTDDEEIERKNLIDESKNNEVKEKSQDFKEDLQVKTNGNKRKGKNSI